MNEGKRNAVIAVAVLDNGAIIDMITNLRHKQRQLEQHALLFFNLKLY